jgi:hypothetical protein
MSKAELSAHEAAQLRLADLQAEFAGNHPEIYRHLALYLQVLRDHLLSAVHQACFHLVTQVHPQRYGALPLERRRRLQRRLEALVRRTRSLLTVEQLACLAAELHEERQQRILEALEERQRAQISEQVPTGSVKLGLELPLSAEGWTDPSSSSGWAPTAEEAREEITPDLDAFHGLPWSLASIVPAAEGHDQSLLPSEPILLLQWLEGHEQALSRRLRNLSHAINVELLRHGVSSALLPMNLLDGALQGHLEVQAAPPGVLCLRLPFPGDDQKPAPLQASAVLLRLEDLEHGHPPLRTCRNRLRQAAQQVRRMAREFASLQRRLASLEAEELWLQDVQAIISPLP